MGKTSILMGRLASRRGIRAAAAAGAAFAILASSGSLAADPNALAYEPRTKFDPELIALWSDAPYFEDDRSIGYDTRGYIAKVFTAEGVELVVTHIHSAVGCNNVDCPTRVFIDERMVFDGAACQALEYHSVAPSLRTMTACGDIKPLTGR